MGPWSRKRSLTERKVEWGSPGDCAQESACGLGGATDEVFGIRSLGGVSVSEMVE